MSSSDPQSTSVPGAERPPSSPYVTALKASLGVVTVLAGVAFAVAARDVLVLVVVSLLLAIGLQASRRWLLRRGLSRGWTVAVIILVEVAIAALLATLVVPRVISEFTRLIEQAPGQLRRESPASLLGVLNERFDLAGKVESFEADLPKILASGAGDVGALIFGVVTVAILTTYFTVGMPALRRGVSAVLRRDDRESFEAILEESTERVGGYIRGNLLISLIAGLTSFVALLVIGVPSAAALAFFVALVDLVPIVGAIIGAGAAVFVAAFVGTPQMIATAIFFLVYQQVENYVIQPRVMRGAIDMPAAAVIVAVLIGGSLLGIVGALAALPLAAIAKVALDSLYLDERVEAVRAEERRPWFMHGSSRRGSGSGDGTPANEARYTEERP